jgi:phosphoglycerate dehydrogenase-like enzyme
MRELRRMVETGARVMIAGGGNIGLRVAQALEKQYEVKVIEVSPAPSRVRRRDAEVGTWSFLAMPPTRNCCSRKGSTRWISSSR